MIIRDFKVSLEEMFDWGILEKIEIYEKLGTFFILWLYGNQSSQSQSEVHHSWGSSLRQQLDNPPRSNVYQVSFWTANRGTNSEKQDPIVTKAETLTLPIIKISIQ